VKEKRRSVHRRRTGSRRISRVWRVASDRSTESPQWLMQSACWLVFCRRPAACCSLFECPCRGGVASRPDTGVPSAAGTRACCTQRSRLSRKSPVCVVQRAFCFPRGRRLRSVRRTWAEHSYSVACLVVFGAARMDGAEWTARTTVALTALQRLCSGARRLAHGPREYWFTKVLNVECLHARGKPH